MNTGEPLDPFLPDPLPQDPLPIAQRWMAAAVARGIRNPTAMTLATRDAAGDPAARMVLCRGFDVERGFVVFFTDRDSAKGEQLVGWPRAALVFYWEELERQIRIRGPVTQSPDAESDAYFARRPGGAQISATISRQSQPAEHRDALVEAQESLARSLGVSLTDPAPGPVPRPPRWGGYRVWAEEVELWIGQPNRLHDRARFRRKLEAEREGFRGSVWSAQRLQP
jgi:pyridoxamine 5'-phosphate oxidase